MNQVYGDTDGWWPSDDEVYRYGLWRCWDPSLAPLIVVLCNPSTATDRQPDRTVDKLCGFARRWNRGGVAVVNLYALRNKDPRALGLHQDPLGPLNRVALNLAIQLALRHQVEMLAAWGGVAREHGPEYEVQVGRLCDKMDHEGVGFQAFKVSKDLTPYHPLYLPYETMPVPWNWRRPEVP